MREEKEKEGEEEWVSMGLTESLWALSKQVWVDLRSPHVCSFKLLTRLFQKSQSFTFKPCNWLFKEQ